MPRRVRFRTAAEIDLTDARRWYAGEGDELGDRFATAIDDTLKRIAISPRHNPSAERGVRKALVKHFPYHIYYLHDDLLIDVVAVVHHRRGSAIWRSRL